MTATWKILGFAAGAALVGTVGACTITSTNTGDDDSGIFDDDGGADTSTTSDSGTSDTGTPIPAACANTIFPDGGTEPLGVGSADCTACTQASCCSQLGGCFQDPTGDCQSLEYDCLEPCVEADPSDAGGCANDCASLHPDSVNLHEAWANCQDTNCSTQCQ
ncbi:MAG: hypothetical protein ABI183_17225 [Polyangiaceae bacterium]